MSEEEWIKGEEAAERIRQDRFTLDDVKVWLDWEGRSSAGVLMERVVRALVFENEKLKSAFGTVTKDFLAIKALEERLRVALVSIADHARREPDQYIGVSLEWVLSVLDDGTTKDTKHTKGEVKS